MANIILPKDWQLKGLRPTEESIYHNRRSFVKQLGLLGIGAVAAPGLLSACNSPQSAASKAGAMQDGDVPGFHFDGEEDFYPAARNPKFVLDRKITDKYDATHHNNFYEFINPADRNIYNVYKYIGAFDTSDWKIEVNGLCEKPGEYHLADLIKKIGLEERTYRFRCVERWAMAVPWTGFSLASLLKEFGPQNNATHVRFTTALNKKQMIGVKGQSWYPWPYREGLRMGEAMNEVAFMATGLYGKPLEKQNGAPIRLVVPWKYGYKNIKSISKIEFLDKEPKTFWHQIAPREYPFISNVDPDVPHPRWSQARERQIPNGDWEPTLKYNGYGDMVAKLYS
ncbi:MAG: protein-methionine-sulfoxide reductase catalytic subunit MsrP [Bacteroidota bacterium]